MSRKSSKADDKTPLQKAANDQENKSNASKPKVSVVAPEEPVLVADSVGAVIFPAATSSADPPCCGGSGGSPQTSKSRTSSKSRSRSRKNTKGKNANSLGDPQEESVPLGPSHIEPLKIEVPSDVDEEWFQTYLSTRRNGITDPRTSKDGPGVNFLRQI